MAIGPDELVKVAEETWHESWERGPTRTRWESLPPQVGDTAPDLALPDETGTERRLSELWADGPAVLLFWRHFGCSCGIDRVARLRDEHADLVEAGAATVAMVAQGEPARAAAYKEHHRLPAEVPVLCDPERTSYETYGLLEGLPEQMLYDAPEAYYDRTCDAVRDWIDGRRDTERAFVDNPWQLPGEFVVAADGTIRLAYRYNHCEDFPAPRVLVDAVRHVKR